MIKNLIVFIYIIIPFAAGTQSYWKKVDQARIGSRNGEERTIIPNKYETFSLDLEGMKKYLMNAPLEFESDRKERELLMDVPMPDGKLEHFKVYESPVMDKGISARYPSIKSYRAYSLHDNSKFMRFAISPNGFYAAISTLEGEKYIDPYSSKNIDDYIVYNVKDHESTSYKGIPICGSDDIESPVHISEKGELRATEEVELRVFKIAMACTGEWGRVSRRGTVEKCLADINTLMNRMNVVYEKEMAMRFVIIDENDKLIFLDPATDPYDNSDEGKKLVGLNTGKLNTLISSTSYDVGHVLSICFDIGGVAQLGSACQINKGNGVTCNNDNDLSNIVTRVMAHEVGHQFSAFHTWNICTSAADQRAPESAFEPGSGTTIMSYAGSCGTDNVASGEDGYFHVASLIQMSEKTLSGGNAFICSDKLATGNHFPVLQMPAKSYVIPISTPFELTANATDEDDDMMTFTWEQYDTGELVPLGTASATAPLFRSVKPSSERTRFFPKASTILSGGNDKTEVLPVNSRNLTFKFTVRDNNASGGGVRWDEYKLSSTAQAGPFELIFPKLDNKFQIGETVNVTWNVANTDKAPVNCKYVSIYGSFSGALKTGDSNLVPLALNVPNDGAQEIYIPNRISNFFRIVVKAADNIFLTASTLPSRIEQPTTPGIYFDTDKVYLKACQPEDAIFEINTAGLAGLTSNIQFELISGIPDGASAIFTSQNVEPGQKTQLIFDTKNVVGNKSSVIVIRAFAPGIDTMVRSVTLDIVGGDISGIQTLEPVNGDGGIAALPRYSWNQKTDATSYIIEVATSPDFSGSNIVTRKEVVDVNFLSDVILSKAKVYYWRVRGKNECGLGDWTPINAFITEALSCTEFKSGIQTINISGAGTPVVELPIQILAEGTANDVNVKLIKAEHSRPSDLVVYLVAPSGKEGLLWSKKCGGQLNVNVGLDDQSPEFFQCPMNTGKIYRPETLLSAFNGQSIKGNWKIRVEDKNSGSGGKLQEFNLEICSNIVLDQPYLVKNDTLKIHPGNKSFITNNLLLCNDNNNTSDELTYTLVDVPKEGILTFNGLQIFAGARFTQTELNNSKVRYEAINGSNGSDYFSFTVEDGQGGWISITRFNILRDEEFVNATNEADFSSDIFVNPNPASNDINIVLTGQALGFTNYFISDLSGRNILSGKLGGYRSTISINEISAGIYLLRLSNGRNVITKKVIKI